MLASYAFSLLATYAVMQWSAHPQPALIYIVPICTFALALRTLFGGQRELSVMDYSANTLAMRQTQLNAIV